MHNRSYKHFLTYGIMDKEEAEAMYAQLEEESD